LYNNIYFTNFEILHLWWYHVLWVFFNWYLLLLSNKNCWNIVLVIVSCFIILLYDVLWVFFNWYLLLMLNKIVEFYSFRLCQIFRCHILFIYVEIPYMWRYLRRIYCCSLNVLCFDSFLGSFYVSFFLKFDEKLLDMHIWAVKPI